MLVGIVVDVNVNLQACSIQNTTIKSDKVNAEILYNINNSYQYLHSLHGMMGITKRQ